MTDDKPPREWAPRLWEGMDFFAWLRLLAQGRGRVEPAYWYIAAVVGSMSFANTLFRWVQTARHGAAINRIRIDPPPLFVLGHWRTGTTLLHELLLLDERHVGPTTLHCFEPCHCILSETLFRKHLAFLLPEKRPMDNMSFGWDKPQEDEFAMALLGQPSTYTEIAWPNEEGQETRGKGQGSTLDLSNLSRRQLHDWKRTLTRFLKMVLFLDNRGRRGQPQRRLVLKSPPHTARIPVLLEMFPEAKFVYLKRDPHVLFPSTINLWNAFAKRHGLQTPRRPDLTEAKVLREFRLMIERYEATKHLIPPGHLVEMRYEDLASDLAAGTQRIYEGLNLDGWERVKPKIEESAAKRKSYSTNRYEICDNIRAKVKEHWGDIVERWGYSC
jgi:hypothetical protein